MSKVEREITVQAPADTVYSVWRNFENFPNFMSNIEEVQETGTGRSHWKAKGPLGAHAEWDAEIVVDEPAQAIAWRSIDGEGSNVCTHGAVRFNEEGDATRLFVTLSYDAPAGGLGEFAAKVFANPEKQIEEDLRRFKEMVEGQGKEGYTRATQEVVGHGEPDTDLRVSDSVDTNATGDSKIPAGTADSKVQGKRPQTSGATEPPHGAGMSNDESVRGAPQPTTTGTPGGTLGAPTEGDLKRDQEAISDRTDARDPSEG